MTTKKFKDLDKVSNEDLTMWINKMLKGKRLNINGINFYKGKSIDIETVSFNFVRLTVYQTNNKVEIAGTILELTFAVVEVTENDVTIWDRTRSVCNTAKSLAKEAFDVTN